MAEHLITVRVYYEDTDFSGRVYHASYLRFLERGRTEWLRSFGLQHDALAAAATAFAVTKLEVEFLAPAHIDDLLEIATQLQACRGPVLIFQQCARKQGRALVQAAVEVVTLKGDRPTKPPRELREALQQLKRR